MEVDTIYKTAKDLAWEHIKTHVPTNSISLSFYKACLERYITKKTIWNIMSRMKDNGVLCINCVPENLSDVMQILKGSGVRHDTLVFYNEKFDGIHGVQFTNCAIYFVIAYKTPKAKLNGHNILKIDTDKVAEGAYTYLCEEFSDPEDIVLLVGNDPICFVGLMKNLCLYIVGFGNYECYIDMAEKEGLRCVEP